MLGRVKLHDLSRSQHEPREPVPVQPVLLLQQHDRELRCVRSGMRDLRRDGMPHVSRRDALDSTLRLPGWQLRAERDGVRNLQCDLRDLQ